MPFRELNTAQWAKLLRMARYLLRFRKLRIIWKSISG